MDDSRLDKLERRLDELDQRSGAMERAMERAREGSRAAMNSVLPSQTRQHLKNAGREHMLAVRSLLDYWVDRLGDQAEKDTGQHADSGRENIPID